MGYEFIKSNLILIVLIAVNLLLIILYIVNIIKTNKINKEYKQFIKKLGNGDNIAEMLREYIDKVEYIEKMNKEMISFCSELEKNMNICIQKVGIVRYNAFRDTGSDLSFALALLDNNNNGVVLNGIYSREMSNIYAKQIINGESNNKLSEEEVQALNKALNK